MKSSIGEVFSLQGNKLYPFQKESVEFISRSGNRCLVAHQCGLGKTVIALAWLAEDTKNRLPALAVVKSSLATQWQHQFMDWCSDNDEDGLRFAQIVSNSNEKLLKGIPMYIISYDLLRRFSKATESGQSTYNLADEIERLGIKTLLVDEVQQIKNHNSQRARELSAIAGRIPNIIGLSGTPIKNNPAEFYSFLHMIRGDKYPTYAGFVRNHLAFSYNRRGKASKILGLAYPQEFQRETETFITRKTREEVLPELPKISRQPMFVDLGDVVKKAYEKKLREFAKSFNGMGGKMTIANRGHILGLMSELRHLTGYAKIDPCLDYCMDFLASTDTDRLLVFCHHRDVAQILADKLTPVMAELDMSAPVNLVGLDASVRERLKDEWLKTNSRVLILSTLASGEGLDGLQTVSHQLVALEREWNPANEDQVVGRVCRIGQEAQSIEHIIFVAVGTIDEKFAEIVEKKRQSVDEALDGTAPAWDESEILMELAEVLASLGTKAYHI